MKAKRLLAFLPIAPRLCLAVLIFACVLSHQAKAGDLFTFQITVDGASTVRNGVNDIRNLSELFDDLSLREMFSGYVPGESAVSAAVDLRGVKAHLDYSAGSRTLRLSIPVLGIDVQFQGADRNESRKPLEHWLNGRGGRAGVTATVNSKEVSVNKALEKLLNGVVNLSPVDPVAGNPNSLQSQMVMADFNRSLGDPWVPVTSGTNPAAPSNLFRAEVSYGGANQGNDFHVNAVALNLGAVFNFQDPHWAMLLDVPTVGTFTESSESIMFLPGVGVQYRVNDWWHLTAFGRGGAVGSVSVGALAAMYSASLTSYMRRDFGKLTLGWGVMAGYIHTIDGIEVDGYSTTYDVGNYPLGTGLDLSGALPFHVFGQTTAWTVYGNYMHLFGTELYMQSFSEVGVAFRLTRDDGNMQYDRTRLRLGYVFGRDFNGVTTSLVFNF